MNKFLKTILFSAIFSTISVTAFAQDSNITKINDFYIGQTTEEIIDICNNKLKYTIFVDQVNSGIYNFVCEPNSKYDTKEYNLLSRGKPNHIILLVIENKVYGIHMTFLKQNVYKKSLVNFINSNVIKTEIVNFDKIGSIQMYHNAPENWIGWFSEVNKEIPSGNELVEKRIYIIHLEYIFKK